MKGIKMYHVTANYDSKYTHNPIPSIEGILRSNGTFIGVTYKTMKGEHRYYNGRIGVHGSDTRNNGRYIRIYDVKLGEFRTLRKEGIKEIRANGVKISYRV